MIISNLSNSKRIEKLHPLFKRFFDFVKTHDWKQMPYGRVEVQGEELFINHINPECVSADKQVLEMHRDYIDVHVLLEGKETIGWKTQEELKEEIKPYEKESDCSLYADDPSTFVSLLPGEFLIAFPEDPHAPVIGKGKIKKLIGKIKI